MAVTKRSVSLDDAVAARVERAARTDGMSFSAWLSAAAERALLLREGQQGVAEWEAEAGQLSTAERAAGEALLDHDRLVWALHRASLSRGLVPTVPVGVLTEAWRGGPQHNLSRLLKGCRVENLLEVRARAIGTLIARSGLSDIVDVPSPKVPCVATMPL